jgi:hypothetical protein
MFVKLQSVALAHHVQSSRHWRSLMTKKSPFALLLALPLLGAACFFESDDDDPEACQTECEDARASCEVDCDDSDDSCRLECGADEAECSTDCD